MYVNTYGSARKFHYTYYTHSVTHSFYLLTLDDHINLYQNFTKKKKIVSHSSTSSYSPPSLVKLDKDSNGSSSITILDDSIEIEEAINTSSSQQYQSARRNEAQEQVNRLLLSIEQDEGTAVPSIDQAVTENTIKSSDVIAAQQLLNRIRDISKSSSRVTPPTSSASRQQYSKKCDDDDVVFLPVIARSTAKVVDNTRKEFTIDMLDDIIGPSTSLHHAAATIATAETGSFVKIKTRLNDKGGHVSKWKLQASKTFQYLRTRLADMYGVQQAQVKLRFDGDDIGDSDSPGGLGMDDDDMIDVFIPKELHDAAIATANSSCKHDAPTISAIQPSMSSEAAPSEKMLLTITVTPEASLEGHEVSFAITVFAQSTISLVHAKIASHLKPHVTYFNSIDSAEVCHDMNVSSLTTTSPSSDMREVRLIIQPYTVPAAAAKRIKTRAVATAKGKKRGR